MQLSKNFNLLELVKSDLASRLGIDNTPGPQEIKNLQLLVTNILQPLRDKVGPIIINSAYRSPALNKAAGGSETSDHMLGLAADIECQEMSNYDLARVLKDNFKFKQVILEFYTRGQPSSGWVHVSYGDKGQVLTAYKEKGKTVYGVGLLA
jgi:hypothetical protein